MAYKIDGDDEQNRMQVKLSSKGQTGGLEVRSKGQVSLNFDYHVNSKIFIPNFVCVLHVLTNKRWKTYRLELSFCCWGHALGMGHGGARWVKNFSVGICEGAPIDCAF